MTLRNRTEALLAALAIGAATAVSGCNREPAPETQTGTAQPPSASATAVDPLADARITTAVQARLYTEDGMRVRDIDVDTQNGTVTLSGTVPDEQAKQHAATLARAVDGVRDVQNDLQVQPVATTADSRASQREGGEVGTAGRDAERMPGWITTKIQAQYFVNPELSPWNIDVTTASGGVVTLEGTVDSADDKTEAVRVAQQTEGVTRVEDRLRVVAEGTPADRGLANVDAPDPWLTAKIQAKYFLDADVKGHRIDVDTREGVVTLTGTLAHERARRQAVALARNTDGVREVKDNLRVDPAVRDAETKPMDTPQGEPARVERPDGWITMKIQAQYFLDPDVKGHEINVNTNRGVVTLKGSVDSATQKTEAEQIARDTEGVSRVVNQLTIEASGR